jgi:hypothetical protein
MFTIIPHFLSVTEFLVAFGITHLELITAGTEGGLKIFNPRLEADYCSFCWPVSLQGLSFSLKTREIQVPQLMCVTGSTFWSTRT